jgi:urease accessory protein
MGEALLTLTSVVRGGDWAGPAVDTVALDYDGRHRRRIVLTGASGAEYLLDLAEATHLKGGDGLRLPSGGVVEVVARAEPLLEVRAASPAALVRLAWHLGNRHLAAQVFADRILIRRDHVIDPEGGAYHDQGHSHDH